MREPMSRLRLGAVLSHWKTGRDNSDAPIGIREAVGSPSPHWTGLSTAALSNVRSIAMTVSGR